MLLLATAALTLTSFPAEAVWPDGFSHLEPDEVERFRPVHTGSSGVTLAADIDSITAPVISPDGKRIAFSGAVGDESLGLYAIFTADIDGTDLKQETPGAFAEFDPVWAPDGGSIVFSQNQAGSYLRTNCCRIAYVDLSTGVVSGITGSIGAIRPAISPDGSLVAFDNPTGVWTVPLTRGTPTLRVSAGFDATFSPRGDAFAFVNLFQGRHYLQTVALGSTVVNTKYSATRTIESPVWRGGRIHFFEFSGAGYEGRSTVQMRSLNLLNSAVRIERSFVDPRVGLGLFNNDELMFYRDDGLFRFYGINSDGTLPSPILAGDKYTRDWDSIAAVDLDADGQDELFFYRDDGLFRFYHIRPDGTLPSPLLQGDKYTTNWDSITAVDLDGDGQDEMFFYRTDGLFRYYQVNSDGTLPLPLRSGSDYTLDWSEITAIDLDGDGQDELFFYRQDGLYRFYNIRADARLGPAISGGTDYAPDWDTITAIDLDGDGLDELLFYRNDGSYRYHDVGVTGELGAVLSEGNGYTSGWDRLTPVDLDSTP